jgi:hypothetical protein
MQLRKLASLAAAASVLAFGAAAHATTTVWTFSNSGSGAVDGSATLNLVGDTLTIDLTSLLASPRSDAQEVSGIQIFFSAPATGSVLTSASGNEINITGGKGGITTSNATDGTIGHWGTAVSGGSVFLATAGTGAAGGQPYDLILGPGPYTNANSSIIGKDPQIDGTGHFVLTLAGLTDAYVTKVNLGFGTTGSDYRAATCSGTCGPPVITPPGAVPEPASWALMILGVGGVGAMMRRQRLVLA